jgi:hypothetical protein
MSEPATIDPDVDVDVANIIDLICRQTSYSQEEAAEKLAQLKDPMKVIQGYMVPQEVVKPARNTHQMIYHEISKFVEETSQQHVTKKR